MRQSPCSSVFRDADIAQEPAALTKHRSLTQASSAILSQANAAESVNARLVPRPTSAQTARQHVVRLYASPALAYRESRKASASRRIPAAALVRHSRSSMPSNASIKGGNPVHCPFPRRLPRIDRSGKHWLHEYIKYAIFWCS